MDTDSGTNGVNLEELFYIGIVTSYGEQPGTVRVTRADKDNRVSAELPVKQIGSKGSLFFRMPAINEQVICMAIPNAGGKGVGDGFVLGGFYNEIDKPLETDNNAVSFVMKDGSYLRFDGKGNVELHAANNFLVTVGGQVRMDRKAGRFNAIGNTD